MHSDLIVDGAVPATWEPWAALGALAVLLAAGFFMLRLVARRAARLRARLPCWVRVGVPAGFCATLFALYWPLWRYALLEATGEVEATSVVSGERRTRFPTKPRYRRVYCYVDVRTARGETWTAYLREPACRRLAHERISTPFVVSRATRLMRQPGLHPEVDMGWLTIAVVAAFTFVLIGALAARREAGRPPFHAELAFRLRRWREKPRPGAPLRPDTLDVARRRWSSVRYDYRFDAELPPEQRFVEKVLFGARAGEAIEVAYFPIGEDGQDDPNFAEHFWVRLRGDPASRDEQLAGPVRLL